MGAVQFKPENGLEVITNVRSPRWALTSLAADGISVTLVLLTGTRLAGVLFWERRAPHQRVSPFLRAHRRRLWRVRSTSSCSSCSTDRHRPEILPHRHLGFDAARLRGDEANALLFIGSGMVLIRMLAAYAVSGLASFDLQKLAQHSFAPGFSAGLPLVFIGFASRACGRSTPGHRPVTPAPTAASMLLAGVVMKLGAYSACAWRWPLPEGLKMWQTELAALAVTALSMARSWRWCRRTSSSSSAIEREPWASCCWGWRRSTSSAGRAVLQMFSHGIIAACCWRGGPDVYDRAHAGAGRWKAWAC